MHQPVARTGGSIWTALLVAVATSACTDAMVPPGEPPAEYITVRRAWRPGERDSLIQRIMANHEFTFPYVGDVSALAPQIYADSDSVVIMVPNPAFHPSAARFARGGLQAALMAPQFSSGWTFVAFKITSVNNQKSPPDTLLWHMTLWRNPADAGTHGFALAFSRNDVFSINPINTTNFDAANGKAGAAAGEYHLSTTTLWEDIGGGGTYQATSQVYPGVFSSVTTGPYLGGQSRSGTVYGRIANSKFARVSGAESPANFTVSFDYRLTGLPAVQVLCVFPTPCTTNVPALMAQARTGAPVPLFVMEAGRR